MCFTGNPGTGKTTVAMRMAEILHRLGYIERNHVVAVTRDDLVGQYVGHTAPKTKEVLKRASGGVLFIDEAYYLYRPENERDYGVEAIEILLQVMENERERLVVILAGYKDRMDEFFALNPGMSSRVAHHIDFPDYTAGELMAIAQLMLAAEAYEFSPDADDAFEEYLERRMRQPRFAHARSVRNAIERARLRHANRVYEAARQGRRPDARSSSRGSRRRTSAPAACSGKLSGASHAPPRDPRRRRRLGGGQDDDHARPRPRARRGQRHATSAPTTTTATTAGSERSSGSRRCTRTATTSTSSPSTCATCAAASRSSSPSTGTATGRSGRRCTSRPSASW